MNIVNKLFGGFDDNESVGELEEIQEKQNQFFHDFESPFEHMLNAFPAQSPLRIGANVLEKINSPAAAFHEDWKARLQRLGFPQLVTHFVNDGWCDYHDWCQLTDAQLITYGLKPGEISKFRRVTSAPKQANNAHSFPSMKNHDINEQIYRFLEREDDNHNKDTHESTVGDDTNGGGLVTPTKKKGKNNIESNQQASYYRGVIFEKGKWKAAVWDETNRMWIHSVKSFDTEKAAAERYDQIIARNNLQQKYPMNFTRSYNNIFASPSIRDNRSIDLCSPPSNVTNTELSDDTLSYPMPHKNVTIRSSIPCLDGMQTVDIDCSLDPRVFYQEGTPRKVGVWVDIRSISEIDLVHQTFAVKFEMHYCWQPSKIEVLAYLALEKMRKANEWKPLWKPQFGFANLIESTSHDMASDCFYRLLKNGAPNEKGFDDPMRCEWLIKASVPCQGKFVQRLHLKHFPFDCQNLAITVWARHTRTVMVFVPCYEFFYKRRLDKQTVPIGTLSHKFSSVSDWRVHPPIVDIHTNLMPEIEFHIKVERQSNVYMFRFALYIFLVTCAAMTTFYCDPIDAGADRLNLAFTALLTAIAFHFSMYQDMPNIPYMTLMDWYVLLNFLFLFSVLWESAWVIHTQNVELEASVLYYLWWGIFIVFHIIFGIVCYYAKKSELKKLYMNGSDLKRGNYYPPNWYWIDHEYCGAKDLEQKNHIRSFTKKDNLPRIQIATQKTQYF